jgi:hypothetical protein
MARQESLLVQGVTHDEVTYGVEMRIDGHWNRRKVLD